MRVLVVDDEPLARTRLVALLAEVDARLEVGEAAGGEEALARVHSDAPDVLLLDIRMPEVDGLTVAQQLAALPEAPAVVFTTAYDQHALAAFDARAVDYLLKPVRLERLRAALERARRVRGADLEGLRGEVTGPREHIVIPQRGGILRIPVAEIRYLKADQKYVTAGTPQGEYLLNESLRALEQELGERFLRIHRNALVAVHHIQGLERDRQGRHHIRLSRVSERLEVSRRMLKQVRERVRAMP